jgi:hypothetical protein
LPSSESATPGTTSHFVRQRIVSMKAFKKVFGKAKTGEKSGDVAATLADDLSDNAQENPSIVRALSELTNATATFQDRYMGFVKKNARYIRVDDDVYKAIEKAGKEKDIKRSAKLFGEEIKSAVEMRERKKDLSQATWLGKLANFMSKVYPVARLSLRLTSTIADVVTFSILLI